MALIPFAQFGPDRSTFDAQFCDVVLNCMPLQGGYGPFPSFMPFSQPLPQNPMGTALVYVINGAYRLFVGSATKLYMFDISNLGWLDKTRRGADTTVNGGFDADVSWTKGTGWTIAGGVAQATSVAVGQTLSQAQALTAGKTYQITYSVLGRTAGAVRPCFTGGTKVNGVTVNANGVYTDYLTAVAGNNTLAFEAQTAATTLQLDAVTIKPINDYNTAAGIRWDFAQFGDTLVATNGADQPQWIDVNVADAFADNTLAPKAQNVAAIGDFIMFSHLASNQRAVQWSGLNQPFFWTPRERSSDYQAFPDGGEIMATVSGSEGVVIFAAESIRKGNLALDTPLVFTFQSSVPNHGCLAPRSVIATGQGIFYFSDDGFYKYGEPPTPIGVERVDRWFLDNIQNSDIYDVYGGEDPMRKVVYWAFRSVDNPIGGTYDKVLLYHYGIDQWSLLAPGTILTGLVDATTPGYTLDGLDALGPIDKLPFSLDSRAWTGSTPLIAAFDQDRRLGYFSGTPMPAIIQTVDSQLTDGQRTMINGFRPLTDAASVSGRTATKERPGDNARWRTSVPNNRTGMVPQITSGQFHRFEVAVPSQRWENIHGVFPVDPTPDGDQ